MLTPKVETEIAEELSRADHARGLGNEGMARVCARRAAGFALREYFSHLGEPVQDPSAYALMRRLEGMGSTPADIKLLAASLLTRVTTDYRLPDESDLLAQARQLIAWISSQIQGE